MELVQRLLAPTNVCSLTLVSLSKFCLTQNVCVHNTVIMFDNHPDLHAGSFKLCHKAVVNYLLNCSFL